MRFELAGQMTPSGPPNPGNPSNPPLLLLTYTANDTINLKSYADLGYTTADVICIGAAGGKGGYYEAKSIWVTGDSSETPGIKAYGGAGGGGGFHKIVASLLGLPDTVNIVVGQGGAAGASQIAPDQHTSPRSGMESTTCTDGSDGGYSSFNDTTCRASGGKGGKSPKHITWSGADNNYMNSGGDGGIGDSITAGGGGHGAIQGSDLSGVHTALTAATPGSYDGVSIGDGGGGGAGGAINAAAHNAGAGGGGFDTPLLNDAANFSLISASPGAGGSYDATDLSAYSAGSGVGQDPAMIWGATLFPLPGKAGGAKATALNGLATTYGDGTQVQLADPGHNGVVVVLLSAK